MKKFTTFVAAAALVAAAAAPVLAEGAKTNADPFVSTQGSNTVGSLGVYTGTIVAVIAGAIIVGAVAASGGDGSSATTTTN